MIKNILFDLGGVLYDIDFKKSFEAFEHLGLTHMEEAFSQYSADALFQNLETGKTDPAVFYNSLQQKVSRTTTKEQIKEAFNAMLLGFRKESIAFLPELKKNYDLYLLSNTNAIHYEFFSNRIKEETGYRNLESFFTKAYYSHIIQLRKPDTETYAFILNDAGIVADETLFIDDTRTNLPNAEKLGMKTHLLLPGEKIESLDYSSY